MTSKLSPATNQNQNKKRLENECISVEMQYVKEEKNYTGKSYREQCSKPNHNLFTHMSEDR